MTKIPNTLASMGSLGIDGRPGDVVKLSLTTDTYTVDVANGHRCMRVEGSCDGPAEPVSGIMSAHDWKSALKGKGTATVSITGDTATFTTRLTESRIPTADVYIPDMDRVLPKEPPTASVWIDLDVLLPLLKAFQSIMDRPTVTLEIHKGPAIAVRGMTAGNKLTGLASIMEG